MTLLGLIPSNDPADFDRQTAWLGRKPDLTPVFFDQRVVNGQIMLKGYQWIIDNVAKPMIDKGAHIVWCIPAPGPGQLEQIIDCQWDSLYWELIAAIKKVDTSPKVDIRLIWEFNFAYQDNAAKSKAGVMSARLHTQAFARLSALMKHPDALGARARIWWNPNACTYDLDPELARPPLYYYDVVAQDIYMGARFGNSPGAFPWFVNESKPVATARGLQWGYDLAVSKGKPYALGEFGFDSDAFLGDQNALFAWMQGKNIWAHNLWDRYEANDISCRLSAGDPERVALASNYKVKTGVAA